MQASSWIKYQLLLSRNEFQELLDLLGDVSIFSLSKVGKSSDLTFTKEELLTKYERYLEDLQSAKPMDKWKQEFSLGFTLEESCVEQHIIGKERVFYQIKKPLILMQAHFFRISETGELYSMIHHPDAIPWGVQFSFPQIYKDEEENQIFKTMSPPMSANAAAFKKLSTWVRSATKPTPMIFQGKKLYGFFRIGRNGNMWGEKHPYLKLHDLKVQEGNPCLS